LDAERVQEALDKLAEKMKGLEERRQLFDEDSDEFDNYTIQMEEVRLRQMVMKNTEDKKIERAQVSMMKTLFIEIREAVQEYAKENGYDLIIVQAGEEMVGRKLQDVYLDIRMKPVLYASAELNITDKIIDYLNAKYKAERAKKDGMQDAIVE